MGEPLFIYEVFAASAPALDDAEARAAEVAARVSY